jgi:PAS domain S-box-containing protein
VVARSVAFNSTGQRAGILPGDRLVGVSGNAADYDEITSPADVQIYLEEAGVGGHLNYLIERPSYPPETRFYYADLYNIEAIPNMTTRDLLINGIGIVYLFVGLFVLFKQGGRAPFVFHFAAMCLTAFVFHCFKPIGAYEDLDLGIAFLDDAALILFAPLFVHFCALYPHSRRALPHSRRLPLLALLYAPAFVLVALTAVIDFVRSPTFSFSEDFIGLVYQAEFVAFAFSLLIGSGILIYRFVKSDAAIVRQQLKWVVWGSTVAVVPFMLLYAVRYIFGADDQLSSPAARWLSDFTVLPLVLIPLTFGNSVVRYRLMDVDMVVRRTAAYALTTLAIALMLGLTVYQAGLYALGEAGVSPNAISLRVVIGVFLMTLIVMMAAPLKNFLQERIDRVFYGARYDLRNGLLDFGRTLSATTALEPLLDALINRLQQVLGVERIAIFIEDERAPAGYRVARAAGISTALIVPPDFREMIRVRSAETGVVRADDLELDPDMSAFVRRALHYYVPCVVRGRMIAVIGLGRSAEGGLLSSEDLQILRTVAGYVAVALENTLLYQEQAQRAAELALLKEFNESIVESINIGLLAVDLQGRVTRCNSALEEILSTSRERAVGQRVEELFAEDFGETLRQVLGDAGWKLTELRHIYKLHTATRDGRALVLNVSLAPLRVDSSNHTQALVVLEDVTARAGLEEQLQQREKLSSIGLLAAGVAHEINTPLTGVSSYTQMLLGMIGETDPKHALLQKVRRQTDRASDIVNNLLNFSRTGSVAEFGEVDVNRVLDATIQLLEPQLRRGHIEIVRAYDANDARVFGNASKLQQVFTNLILNARDAIPDSGQITITTGNDGGDSLVIEVADTGIGIAPENVAKIYDPFFTTKGVGRGTGLGLAVTYGIVQEHSGHISVESQPGKGTIFRLTLPTANARPLLQAVSD